MKLINQQLIKNTNLKQIYHYVHKEPGISRSTLAKYSHLSKTTVSALVDELIEQNFLMDTGISESGTVGRKPNSLYLKPEQHYVAVLFWSESYISGQLVDLCGTSFLNLQIPTDPQVSYPKLSKTFFEQKLLPAISPQQLLGVCIVVPAMIDPDTREIFSTTFQLPQKDTSDLVEELAELFHNWSLGLFNDTACTAYAEKVYTGICEKDFAFINFNKGIGATLFIQDSMLGKATASYTQFGHCSIDPKGKPCSCGNRGCLELLIGEDSLPERLQKNGGSPALKKLPQISYQDIGRAAIYGDSAARKVIRELASDFSLALSNLVCTVHPKLIIIGGKGKELGPLFLKDVQDCLHSTGFRRMLDSVQLRYGLLDENALYNGAMKYFFDIHYNFTQDLTGQLFIG